MNLINKIKEIGFKITLFSTGKPFDPSTQKRTTAFEDIMKKGEKKDERNTGKL